MEVIQTLLFGTGSATAAFWIGLTAFAGVLFGKFEVRRIRLGDELRMKFPLLEARLNAYVPSALKIARFVDIRGPCDFDRFPLDTSLYLRFDC